MFKVTSMTGGKTTRAASIVDSDSDYKDPMSFMAARNNKTKSEVKSNLQV
jgi:hypothetical protein